MREIIEKRPRLNFEQNCPFLKNEKSKINKSFRNGFLGIKNTKYYVFTKEKYSKKCQICWKCQFDTLRRPFWIPPLNGGDTLVFELFSTFSSKMGSKGIKWPIYPEFIMIWNYAQKITPYSPPLVAENSELLWNGSHSSWTPVRSFRCATGFCIGTYPVPHIHQWYSWWS